MNNVYSGVTVVVIFGDNYIFIRAKKKRIKKEMQRKPFYNMELSNLFYFVLGIIAMALLQNITFQYPVKTHVMFQSICEETRNITINTDHRIIPEDDENITIHQGREKLLPSDWPIVWTVIGQHVFA